MNHDSNFLHPLSAFYARANLPLPPVALVEGEEIPEPYRSLLVHIRDMTSTLENYHQSRIHLRVLSTQDESHAFSREVVLVLDGSEKPVEFGAIIIYLDGFDAETQELIRAGQRPLGGILNSQGIAYVSRPQAFFRVTADPLIKEVLQLTEAAILFGRHNTLFDPADRPLADIVEILPPL
ncbi:MAG: hypothetical protein M3347_04105 [Armatimonadota bacterium]|nr:hypothetical protein [Armatimonadota bacterium]